MQNPYSDLPTPEAVLEFLRQNPEFIGQNADQLAHPAEVEETQIGNVVNFQQVMVQKLRQDKQRAEDRQRLMIDSARTNMTVQARIHAGILRVLEAQNLEEMVEIISSELSLMLEVDVIALVIEAGNLESVNTMYQGIRLVAPGFVDNHLGADRDSVLQANVPGDPRLFGPAARLVKSQALLRLNIAENVPDGVIAFGSRDPLLFADGQGTELVGFLTDVIERMLRHFINRTP